jgi:type I restriction enzyme, S subunit
VVSTPKAVTTDGAWHGAVPAGWSLKQLKWAVTFQRGHDLPTEDRQEGSVPVVTGGGITGWHNAAQARGPGIVTGGYGTIGEFYLVEQDYWPLNTSLYSVDLHGNHASFLRYMLEPLAPLFHLNAAKSAVPGIDRSDIHTIPVAVPPLATQRAIADYLDRETGRLDALVAKERVLGLLAGKRRALITRAVTRGLDPRSPVRDSGTPWLGEIPAHWAATRLKFVAEVQGGLTLGKNYGAATLIEYPYLRVANVQDGHLDLSDVARLMVPETEAESCLLKAGDVLMNEGGDADKLGRGCIWAGEVVPCLHQNHVFAVRPRLVRSEWLNAWTSTEAAKAFFESRAKQSTNLASISAANIKELPIPVPSVDEQSAIVSHITAETAKLDALRSATERTIALLKERRAALIAAAVTGKLDVQGAEHHLAVVAD